MALLAHYAFEDNFNDDSGNAFTGAGVGETDFVAGGQVGKCLSMAAGQNGFSSPVGLRNACENQANWTLDLYIKPTEIDNDLNCIFRDKDGKGSNYFYIKPDGSIWGNFGAGVGGIQTAAGIIVAGSFQRVTFVLDGEADTFKIYVDDVVKHTESDATLNIFWGADLGFYYGVSNWADQDLACLMDELKVYDSAEVPSPPPPPPSPEAGANRDFCNPRARSGFHCFVGQFCKNRNRHATPWRTPDAVLYTG